MTNQIVYCVALLLQGAVFAAFVTVSLTPRWRASVCFALYLAGEMISVVVSFFFGFPFSVGMLIETVMFALQTFALFKDSNAKKLIVICELLMVAFLADLFLTSLCSALFGISIEDFSKSYALRAYGSLAGTFILAAGYAGVYSVTHRKKALLQNTTLRRFILFPIGQFFLIYCIEATAVMGASAVIMVATLIGAFFCIAADIVILRTMQSFEKNAQLEKQVKMMEYTHQMQLLNYANIQKRELELAKLQHDYKNHLAAVAALVESKDADSVKAAAQMLKSLQKQYSENWLVTYCENPTINAVLTCKHEECVQANMMLQTTIALPGEIPVENVQLCSIFSNLLDNAIRAVKPLAQEMRKITVKANLRGQTLFVKVENPCDSALSQKGTGYGLQILRDIAAQYHGAVMTTEENGIFTAVVTLEL